MQGDFHAAKTATDGVFRMIGRSATVADPTPLKFGIGLFQSNKGRNGATYRPLAHYLSKRLGREVPLRTVNT